MNTNRLFGKMFTTAHLELLWMQYLCVFNLMYKFMSSHMTWFIFGVIDLNHHISSYHHKRVLHWFTIALLWHCRTHDGQFNKKDETSPHILLPCQNLEPTLTTTTTTVLFGSVFAWVLSRMLEESLSLAWSWFYCTSTPLFHIYK